MHGKRDCLVNTISKIKSHIYADTIFEFKKRKDDFRFCKTSDHSYLSQAGMQGVPLAGALSGDTWQPLRGKGYG